MIVHLMQVMMGIMMISHVEHAATNQAHIHDIHLLDVVYLVFAVPVALFLAAFFISGNVWFLSFDFNTAAFVGTNAMDCRQSLTVGTTCIVFVWISLPACALYMVGQQRMNAAAGSGTSSGAGKLTRKQPSATKKEYYDEEIGGDADGNILETESLLRSSP